MSRYLQDSWKEGPILCRCQDYRTTTILLDNDSKGRKDFNQKRYLYPLRLNSKLGQVIDFLVKLDNKEL